MSEILLGGYVRGDVEHDAHDAARPSFFVALGLGVHADPSRLVIATRDLVDQFVEP